MWSIILLSFVFVSSSAQKTDNITHKTEVLQKFEDEYSSIIDNIASYISDTMFDKCKNTSTSLKKEEETCDKNCKELIRRCLQSAANMSLDDLPHDVKSEVARLVLFNVVYVVSSMRGHENESNETVTDAQAMMDATARRIDEEIRESVNTDLAIKSFLGDSDNRKIRPRFNLFATISVSYRISKFVYRVGYPMLRRLLKGGLANARKQLSKDGIRNVIKGTAVTPEMEEELKNLLIDILKDLTGVGILFDLLDLSRSLIDQ
uniref:Uncharacterized protein n=1 Tax=Cuerna arida TaxID=1464854 RepID=A0A1B6EPY4_9HEMI